MPDQLEMDYSKKPKVRSFWSISLALNGLAAGLPHWILVGTRSVQDHQSNIFDVGVFNLPGKRSATHRYKLIKV